MTDRWTKVAAPNPCGSHASHDVLAPGIMWFVVMLPLELIDALRARASDPQRFIDASEFGEFRYPPATPEQIHRAEDRIGFRLPEGLRTLYSNVANGGFGPGYGILGVDDGATNDLGDNLEGLYHQLSAPDPEVPEWEWRDHAVPFCYWGCQVYSCVMPDGVVVDLDGYDWRGSGIPLVEWLSGSAKTGSPHS